jgi:hypothetical protein
MRSISNSSLSDSTFNAVHLAKLLRLSQLLDNDIGICPSQDRRQLSQRPQYTLEVDLEPLLLQNILEVGSQRALCRVTST